MRSLLTILFALGFCTVITAQEEQIMEQITSIMVENGNEQGTSYIQETINDLLQNPINLNTGNAEHLLECGLFNPYQVYGILQHREEYGDFYSIYEMMTIPGFQKSFLQDIQPLVTISEQEIKGSSSKVKGMLLSNIYLKLPESEAYFSSDSTAPHYPGSPIKLSNRLRVDIGDKLVIGGAYEKDAGEIAFDQWMPEHLTGYISYSPGKFLRNICVGNYRLHTGMGLVHGLGFNSSGSGVQLNGFRAAYSKPFASTAEYDYYRGLLLELELKKWNSMLFYSYKPEDISLYGIDDSTVQYMLFDAKRETGIHRTETEMNGRKLAYQHSAGFSLNRNQSYINMGIEGAASYMSLTQALHDSVPFLASAMRYKWNISAYAVSYGENHEAYAEIAINELLAPALLIGANYHLNSALSFHASFRHYHPDYNGQFPSAYSTGSEIENETGIHAGVLIIPFNNARILLDHDLCYFPSSDYLSTPGFNTRSKLVFNYSFKNGPDVYIRCTSRQGEEKKSQYRLHYSYDIAENLKLAGRMEWAFAGSTEPGFLMYQQLQVKQNRLSLTYRLLLFDIDSWDKRIYCYEPGVRYSFSFPAYYGNGVKNSIVVSAKLSRWLSLRFRLGHIHYANIWETGSAYDIREGDQQYETEFQLQLSF
ncbi:helix-hairpin-helix domain-containing protein [Bacteroidota bacterium]